MAGFFSEVTAKLGVDITAFKRGMTEAQAVAGQAAGGIAKKFEARDLGRTLATALGLNLQTIADKLVEPFKESADAAERIAKYSEEAADATQRMLDARKTDLQQLADMERRLEKIMSGRSNAEGPGFFSRALGLGLNAIGQTGLASKFLVDENQLAEERSKNARDAALLSEQIAAKRAAIEKKQYDEELKNLQEIRDSREKQAESEKALYDFRRRAAIEDMTMAQRIFVLTAERERIEETLAFWADKRAQGVEISTYRNGELLKLEERRREIQKDIADETKRAAQEAKKLAEEYYRAQTGAAAAAAALSTAKRDAISASLGDLAAGGGTGRQQFTAQEIMRLEAQARRQNLMGFTDLANQSQSRALALRSGLEGLVSSERNPFASQLEQLKLQTDELKKISESLAPTVIR